MSIGPYPEFAQMAGSTISYADDLAIDRSDSGNVRMRAMYPAKKRIFEVVHWLSSDDMQSFEDHYDDNSRQSFSFTWTLDGNSYLCVYGGKPTFTTTNAIYTEAKVTLYEQ